MERVHTFDNRCHTIGIQENMLKLVFPLERHCLNLLRHSTLHFWMQEETNHSFLQVLIFLLVLYKILLPIRTRNSSQFFLPETCLGKQDCGTFYFLMAWAYFQRLTSHTRWTPSAVGRRVLRTPCPGESSD